jgi:hypothetical protein
MIVSPIAVVVVLASAGAVVGYLLGTASGKAEVVKLKADVSAEIVKVETAVKADVSAEIAKVETAVKADAAVVKADVALAIAKVKALVAKL